jgi:hypothetical protein
LKDLKDIRCIVIDRGVFFPVAERLSRDLGEVCYYRPNGEDFETFAQAVRGHGHPDVTLIQEEQFYKLKRQTDLFVFPDCADSGLQYDLVQEGYAVWGSKGAAKDEKLRGKWLDTCQLFGLPMPKTHEIKGLAALQEFLLKEHPGEKYHIKISRFRGDMETWCSKSPEQVLNKIYLLYTKFGPFSEDIIFYTQEDLDTDIEGGADTYFAGGDYPDKIVLGYEKKGESYFATWKERSDMPTQIWQPMEAIHPFLKEHNYTNMVSSEIRVKDGESYWLDPCFRFPSPAGEEELELYSNFSQIVLAGANGELVQPEMAAKFCGEAVISYSGDRDGWKSIRVPEEIQRWVKLYANGCKEGVNHFPPVTDPEAIGCAIALADTPEGVVDGLKDLAEQLKDQPVEIHINPIADLFKEIEEAEDAGIPFSPQVMPEPAEVLE